MPGGGESGAEALHVAVDAAAHHYVRGDEQPHVGLSARSGCGRDLDTAPVLVCEGASRMRRSMRVRIVGNVADTSAGTVVIVDAIRAFTTAAMALAAGADCVLCAHDIGHASSLAMQVAP